VGNGVLGAYGQEVKPEDDVEAVKRKVEKEVERHSYRWEWHEDGSISVTHIVPRKCCSYFVFYGQTDTSIVIRKHIASGKATFYGNLTSAYGRSKHHNATEPPFLGNDGGVSLCFK